MLPTLKPFISSLSRTCRGSKAVSQTWGNFTLQSFSLLVLLSFSLPPWRTGRSPASTRRPGISSRPGRCARRQLWYFDVIHHQWSLITEISMVTLSRRSINFDEFTHSAFEDSERRQKGQVYLRLPQILSWSNLCPNQKFFWDHKEGVPKMQKIYYIYPAPIPPIMALFPYLKKALQPVTPPPPAHLHSMTDISFLSSSLTAKIPSQNSAATYAWSRLQTNVGGD